MKNLWRYWLAALFCTVVCYWLMQGYWPVQNIKAIEFAGSAVDMNR